MPDPARRLLGAAIGGLLGFGLTMLLLLQFQVYLLAACGGGLAFGAGGSRVPRSLPWTIGITLLAFVVGVLAAWHFSAFKADPSLSYFVQNLGQTSAQTKIGLGVTVAIGLFYGGGSGPARRSVAAADRREDARTGL